VAGLPTVLPFHRAIVRDPAFAPAPGEAFSIFTRWIETEFENEIDPWSGSLEETTGPQARHSVVVEVEGRRIEVSLPTRLLPGSASENTAGPAPRRRSGHGVVSSATGDAVKAPMQATIVKVLVTEGDSVIKGDLLLVLEAMKMEQPIVAHKDGIVGPLGAEVGVTVSSGHLLLTVTDPA
jgi:acetyl-CoA/propionyl-CoA carboxylase biotin carboxyl carrier protein